MSRKMTNLMFHSEGQMFLMDRFFDGTFFTFGIEVLSFAERDQEDRIDPMVMIKIFLYLTKIFHWIFSGFQVYIFPRMTKCTFHKFGTSGEIEKHDAMCILPLNIGVTITIIDAYLFTRSEQFQWMRRFIFSCGSGSCCWDFSPPWCFSTEY